MNFSSQVERSIYEVCLKHRNFIEKFVGGEECYCRDNYYQGHAYSYIEEQFDPESIDFIERLPNNLAF